MKHGYCGNCRDWTGVPASGDPPFASGGLVAGPDGGDTVPVLFDPSCEQIFTAEQVKRMGSPEPEGS